MGAGPGDRERLSAADASNLVIDAPDQVNAFLMAGVLASGGPVRSDGGVDLAAVRAAIGARLAALPQLARRVVRDRHGFAWETVEVDLDRHVREAAAVDGLEGPGSLGAWCARLMVTPLPMDRPPWELLVVPGVAPGRVGIVLRVHHAMADGLAAVALVERLLSPEAQAEPGARAAPEAQAAPDPHVDADAPHPSHPNASTSDAPTANAHRNSRTAATAASRLRAAASSVERTASMLRSSVPPTVLLGPIGPDRGVAFAEVALDGLAAGAAAVGATVNDGLLAASVAAVEGALRERGEPVPDALPTSVPVALEARAGSGNAVGVMLVRLPTGEPDVARRLARIAAATAAAKPDARQRGTFELTRTRLGSRLFMALARHQRLVVMFVTDVPGPRHPLSLAGARLERAWPVTAIQGDVRLGISALSYDGMLRCSVHCDTAALDAESVAAGLRAEFARILALGA